MKATKINFEDTKIELLILLQTMLITRGRDYLYYYHPTTTEDENSLLVFTPKSELMDIINQSANWQNINETQLKNLLTHVRCYGEQVDAETNLTLKKTTCEQVF